MRTPSILVLGLVLVSVLVSSAPVEKSVVKREQETIMFGNQQNDPRVMKKKSDPVMSQSAADSTLDKQGYIVAVPAQQKTEETEPEADDTADNAADSAAVENTEPVVEAEAQTEAQQTAESVPDADSDDVEEELKGILAANQDEAVVPAKEEEVQSSEPEESLESLVPEETVETEENEQPAQSEQPEVGSDEADDNNALMPAETEGNNPLLDLYYYMLENERGDGYYPNSDEEYYPYRRRRRSSSPDHKVAATEGQMTRNVLKRSRRIKRDLLDDVDTYYYPYGAGYEDSYEPELSEEDLYELYRPDPRYEDDVAELLDMYEQAQEEPVYEQYVPEEVYPAMLPEEEIEEEFPQYVPSKRQMISSLPGLKKRYFYPFSPEPDTHWGAFVPKTKRSDYENAYNRLIALASALSEESPYYQQYKKK